MSNTFDLEEGDPSTDMFNGGFIETYEGITRTCYPDQQLEIIEGMADSCTLRTLIELYADEGYPAEVEFKPDLTNVVMWHK